MIEKSLLHKFLMYSSSKQTIRDIKQEFIGNIGFLLADVFFILPCG